jgi:hypothetical protein
MVSVGMEGERPEEQGMHLDEEAVPAKTGHTSRGGGRFCSLIVAPNRRYQLRGDGARGYFGLTIDAQRIQERLSLRQV